MAEMTGGSGGVHLSRCDATRSNLQAWRLCSYNVHGWCVFKKAKYGRIQALAISREANSSLSAHVGRLFWWWWWC